jgi:secreted Zn-dependent insulinase-like peptidase
MAKKKTKKQLEQEEFEAMRQRALRPFKPSLTDEDIKEFEEKIRQQSLENMKNNKEELNAYDREKVKERASFIHHFANNTSL